MNITTSDALASSPAAHASTITVYESYHSALHEITQPDKLVACSLYFSRRWMPELGPLGTQIVLILRSLGYYNRKTNELRDGVEIDLPALADLVGVHQATVKREFARNVTLGKFVSRENQYRKCPITEKPIRTTNIYRVKMDDPLHPDDQEAFEAKLYAKEKGGRRAQNALNTNSRTSDPKAQYAPNDVQSVTGAVQTVIETVQSAQETVQIAPTLKDYSYLPKNTINTEMTKTSPPAPKIGGAAFGAVSLSLLEQEAVKEQEVERKRQERERSEAEWLVKVEEQKQKNADQKLFIKAFNQIAKEVKDNPPLSLAELDRLRTERHQKLTAEAASLTAEAAKGEAT